MADLIVRRESFSDDNVDRAGGLGRPPALVGDDCIGKLSWAERFDYFLDKVGRLQVRPRPCSFRGPFP
jgi:hypothetical protein